MEYGGYEGQRTISYKWGHREMEYLSGKAIADTILGVAASIFKYKDEIRKVNADRRDRIADYFLAISKTIEEAASDIERSGRPSGACESLRIFAVGSSLF